MAYVEMRSCCPRSTVRALVPKKAETSEYQISKPPCGARSSPMPVSCGTCGEGGAAGGEGAPAPGGGGLQSSEVQMRTLSYPQPLRHPG